MNQEELHSTHQLSGVVLRVRDDIDILVREYGGKPTYILEDELTSKYFRIGAAEYTFLSMLDGRNTFANALGRTAAIMHRDALTEDRAATFCKWLVQNGIASTEQSRSVERLEEHSEQGHAQRSRGKLGVISQRIPLLHPRKSIDALNRIFGWCFSTPMLFAWIVLIGIGISAIVLDWERFRQSTSTVIARDNWIWLIGVWLMLKVVHESAHALACRRFGGAVREAGVMFIVFVPLPYVDVSSAWRFASKWQRIVTSSAGMMVELAIASVAAIVWSQAGPGLISQNAMNVMFSASVTTLLFNANPLMRFDGYYILTDLLELPNLYTHGQSALLQLGRRWGLGLKGQQQEYPEGRKGVILAYGIAAFVWRILICVGLVLAADALFYGLGTLLAAAAVGIWLFLPIAKLTAFIVRGNKQETPSRVRVSILLATLVGAIVALEFVVPWYSSATAPIVVDYFPQTEVRTPVSGFVEKVNVRAGQRVRKGDCIFQLRNEELMTQLKAVQCDRLLAEQRTRVHLGAKEIPLLEVELEHSNALKKQYKELEHQVNALTVTAPCDGVVLDVDPSDLQDAYVSSGNLLVRIGANQQTEVLAMVPQSQEKFFRSQIDQSVRYHIDGTGTDWHQSALRYVAPRATRQVPHPALAAQAGGPLPVRTSNQPGDDPSTNSLRYELLNPHFLARVDVGKEVDAKKFQPGQTGTMSFLSQDGSVGQHLRRTAIAWWNERRIAAKHQVYHR